MIDVEASIVFVVTIRVHHIVGATLIIEVITNIVVQVRVSVVVMIMSGVMRVVLGNTVVATWVSKFGVQLSVSADKITCVGYTVVIMPGVILTTIITGIIASHRQFWSARRRVHLATLLLGPPSAAIAQTDARPARPVSFR